MTRQLVNGKLEVSMGLLWSPAEVYNAEKNKFRLELTGRGEVVGFSIHAGQAESLTYRKQTFVRVDSWTTGLVFSVTLWTAVTCGFFREGGRLVEAAEKISEPAKKAFEPGRNRLWGWLQLYLLLQAFKKHAGMTPSQFREYAFRSHPTSVNRKWFLQIIGRRQSSCEGLEVFIDIFAIIYHILINYRFRRLRKQCHDDYF